MSDSTYQRLKAWTRSRRQSISVTPDVAEARDDRHFGLDELEPRLLLSAVLTQAIPDQNIYASGGTSAIDLNDFFDNTDITGTVVRYDTVYGDIDVELFDTTAVNTVLNFLGYVDRGDYDGTFFHRNALTDPNNTPNDRTDDVPFVVQGGGFKFTAPNNYDPIFQGPSIVNEFGASNLRGTIAMAKLGGDPDSATNQWFFNNNDNSGNLDNQNGGFTVFGQVLGNGMDVVDMISTTETWNASSLGGAFSDLPLRDFDNTVNFPDNDNLVVINSITRVQDLSYRVVSTTNRVKATVDENGRLTIFTSGASLPETVTITVEAEDADGNTAQAAITVVVTPAKESLNDDRHADLLWRNFKNGKNTLWQMQGFNKTANAALAKVGNTTWYVAATGDFDKDGNIDLLWRNAFDGQNRIWLMDGTTRLSTVVLRTVASDTITIGGVADFNNDGCVDILWHNSKNGKNTVWTMNGAIEDGRLVLPSQPGSQWYIGGVADLDRDGGVDIVWRNDDGGQNKAWLLNPFVATLKQATSLPTLSDTRWIIGGIADYNNDNQYDIYFRNSRSGREQVWQMDGTTRQSTNTSAPNLRNLDWQLPGRASELAANSKAQAKTQRLNNKAAKQSSASQASSSAAAIAASVQQQESTASLLNDIEPIMILDAGNDDQETDFTND